MLLATILALAVGVGSTPFYGVDIQSNRHPPWRNFNDWLIDHGLEEGAERVSDRMLLKREPLDPDIVPPSPRRKESDEDYDEEVRMYISTALRDKNDQMYNKDTIQGKILNMTVKCSKAQKACLRYHRLYVPHQKGCFHLHWKSNNCTVYGDESHFKGNKMNSLQGKCKENNGKTADVACDDTVRTFLKHIFTSDKCTQKVCSHGENCPQLNYLRQPDSDETCVFPDLRMDVLRMITNETFEFPQLSTKQAKCAAEGKVLRSNSCHLLLERGPCLEDQILVLDKGRYRNMKISTKCVFEKCGVREKLMAFDGKCHNEGEVRAALMPGERLLVNWFGEWYAAPAADAEQEVKNVQFLPGE